MGILDHLQADLLQRYLAAFTTTTRNKAPTCVYLDLFAGEPENVDRVTKLPIKGSPRIALGTENPPFTYLRFFELEPNVTKLRDALTVEFVTRNWLVYEDCNASIDQALADLWSAGVGKAPTFASSIRMDPTTIGGRLRPLPLHKRPPKSRTKVELWMLFPAPLFARLLPTSGELRSQDNDSITAMYGDPVGVQVIPHQTCRAFK